MHRVCGLLNSQLAVSLGKSEEGKPQARRSDLITQSPQGPCPCRSVHREGKESQGDARMSASQAGWPEKEQEEGHWVLRGSPVYAAGAEEVWESSTLPWAWVQGNPGQRGPAGVPRVVTPTLPAYRGLLAPAPVGGRELDPLHPLIPASRGIHQPARRSPDSPFKLNKVFCGSSQVQAEMRDWGGAGTFGFPGQHRR